MPDIVFIVRFFQAVCALCWLFPFLICWRSVYRVLFNVRRDGDILSSLLWFMAASQLGFVARWFLWGAVIPLMRRDEVVMWCGMYALSATVAVGVTAVVGSVRRFS